MASKLAVPAQAKERFDAIWLLIEPFCVEHLNDEYLELCRELLAALARKRPTPIATGNPGTWACGVIRTIGWVNFLDDKNNKPHLKLSVADQAFNVASSTGQNKSKTIRDLLKIRQFDLRWTLPSKQGDISVYWFIQINGFVVDARTLPREMQAIAYERGLIPFIHADRQVEK